MNEVIKLLIGVGVLLLGIPIGNLLRKKTLDEQKIGRKWFKLISLISLIGGLIGLLFKEDALMFSFFFIAIVTSRSLKN
jgi:hypothetical protein